MKRNFNADHPNQLWVGDFTYIQTHSGWVYTAFIIDVFSRAIVGWKVSTRMNTDMVLDALEQALHDRGMPKNVITQNQKKVEEFIKFRLVIFNKLYVFVDNCNFCKILLIS